MTETKKPEALSAEQRALLVVKKLRAKLEAMESERTEPIAVVGVACRMPHGANDPERFWRLLADGVDAVTEVPADRWDANEWYDPDPSKTDKMTSKWGAFLDRIDGFDPGFFGISPREAALMDPQHRLLLEVAHEAFESANLPQEAIAGTKTGVYVGIYNADYFDLQLNETEPEIYTATGGELSFGAGRISYVFDLQGPCITVDTVCSSSLVATHLAINALRNRECEQALVGGVNLIIDPITQLINSRLGALSPNGRCRTFDVRADGFVRGEGCGMLVLKRLSDAVAAKDHIWAVIRGSAVNQDGRSAGLTAPSGAAQVKLIKTALQRAGLEPGQISYVEAHGTGTSLGDPIEIEALRETYGTGKERCVLGSVKTNIGHLEAAAGVAGMIKVILSLQHQQIPPHLHFTQLNPRISFEGTAFMVPTQGLPWPREARPRLAAVSSFGLSGTNAHIILEEAPLSATETESSALRALGLSAATETALSALASRWQDRLSASPLTPLLATAHQSRPGRKERLVVVGADAPELEASLSKFVAGEDPPQVVRGTADAPRKVAFLFTGQGAQYPGMARGLYEQQRVFKDALDRCAAALDPLLPRPLFDVLFSKSDDRAIDETGFTQPALFAVEYALAELWRSVGVIPDVVLGHSVGEYGAAVTAGFYSVEDGLKLIAARGRLMQALPAGGAMASINAAAAVVAPFLVGEPLVAIAAINGPQDTVISGEAGAVERVRARFEERSAKTKRLVVSHAFHSPLMDPMLDAFAGVAAGIKIGEPRIPLISNVTASVADPALLRSSTYFREHVRGAVRFSESIGALAAMGVTDLVEIGPKPVLLGMAAKCLSEPVPGHPSLRDGQDDQRVFFRSAGALWTRGAPVQLSALQPSYDGPKVQVPTTPFTRQRYWYERDPLKPRKRSAEASGLYERRWVELSPGPARLVPAGAFVLLLDQGGVGRQLATEIESKGQRVVTVAPGAAFAQVGAAAFTLEPTTSSQWTQLLAQVGQVAGVVHLLALDTSEKEAEQLQRVLGSALALTQALIQHSSGQLWLVTKNEADPVSGALWGFGPVVGLERPERWGGLLAINDASPALIAESLLAPDGEDLVALGRVRKVLRLQPVPATEKESFRAEGTWLITGGMGALGLATAQGLAGKGARRLVLTGRSEPKIEARQVIDQLSAQGVEVVVALGDVAKPADAERVLEVAGPTLSGIVHAAGTLDDGVLAEQSWSRYEKVLGAKVHGLLNLEQALARRGQPLGQWVLYASAASAIGSAGQSGYAAANGFLDGFARSRAALGQKVVSIDWGPWAEAGMAARPEVERRLKERGFTPYGAEDGLRKLFQCLELQRPQVAALPIRWDVFGQSGLPPLFDDLVPKASATKTVAKEGRLKALVTHTPKEALHETLALAVKGEIAKILGFGAEQPLDVYQGLFDLGMDSLMVVEAKNRLQALIGEAPKLPATLVLDHPTIDQLATFLERTLAPDATETVVRVEDHGQEPIAVIGWSCRYPGGATDPEAFWRVLETGVDGIVEIPKDRWDLEQWYDPNPDAPGKMYSRYGGFVEGIDRFDAEFFGISPREAAAMDPQHRLLVEVTWEALERAGQAPERLSGARAGVFVGISNTDYHSLPLRAGDDTVVDAHFGTGNALSAASGRISYLLGLQGPAVSIDTACSSSLVATHLACQSLQRGETDLAIAAGVNLILAPEINVNLSRARMLAPDGRCKTFDASADGYTRGEGCGVALLKRLSDAIADRDPICAIIRGTAINQDGRSVSLTAPNGPAQERVIRDAVRAAGVDATEIVYVEAHGTGTSLGDPIEVGALAATYGQGRELNQPLYVGSVKTNLGHLESGAGMAGLLKLVASFEHQQLPPSLHFRTPNPKIDWAGLPVQVNAALRPWPPGRRLAGLSSFAFVGTNGHAILEAAPARVREEGVERGRQVITLSTKSEAALPLLAAKLAPVFESLDLQATADAAYTLNTGRGRFTHRAALVGTDGPALAAELRNLANGASISGAKGTLRRDTRPKVAFLYTGQGSQYVGMAKGLYDTQPVFRAALEKVAEAAAPHLDRPLLEVIFSDAERIDQTAYTQPALFALGVALTELWRSFGVVPDLVMGHSVGEYAAAVAAGALSLEDGIRLITARGRLMQALPAGGAMAAVALTEAEVEPLLISYPQLSLAAINGPGDVVVSGDGEALERFLARLAADTKVKRLVVSHAFHSPLMDPMLDDFFSVAERISYQSPQISLISNLTGDRVESLSANYWRDHVRAPVRFAAGLKTAAAEGIELWLELGPQPVLLGMGKKTLSEAAGAWLPSLRKGKDDWEELNKSLAELWVRGGSVDWEGYDRPYDRRRRALPTYPFQPRRHWLELKAIAPTAVTPTGQAPLLGRRLRSAIEDTVYETEFSLRALPFLADHVVFGVPVAAGAVHLSLALAAAEQLYRGPVELTELNFLQPLALPEGEDVRSNNLIIKPEHDGARAFYGASTLSSDEDGDWTGHVRGKMRRGRPQDVATDLEAIRARLPEVLPPARFFAGLEARHFNFGPTFVWVTHVQLRPGEVLAEFSLPPAASDAHLYPLFPGLVDSCLQVISATAFEEDSPLCGVPFGVDKFVWHGRRPGNQKLYCHAQLRSSGGISETQQAIIADSRLYDADGHEVAAFENVLIKLAPRETFFRGMGAQGRKKWLYERVWEKKPKPAVTPNLAGERWLILGGTEIEPLVRAAQQAGAQVLLTEPSAEVFSTFAPTRIVHALGLKEAVGTATEVEAIVSDVGQAARMALQYLAQKGGRLHVLTRGAFWVEGAGGAPVGAALWGLGQVAAMELPDHWGGLIDADDLNSVALLAELAHGSENVALRGGQRFVARLERGGKASAAVTIGPGPYLITGGLGGLGLLVAQHLVSQGARRLILLSRGAPQGPALAAISAMQAQGAEVRTLAVDVSDEAALVAALRATEKEAEIRGVIHAAGVLKDGVLLQQNAADFAAVLPAKVKAAWALHRYFENRSLDFMVLFSSAAGLVGSAGQGNYAFANAFLDGLAEYRRARGLAAVSLAWGPWAQAGMAARTEKKGDAVTPIAPEQGLQILLELLGSASPVVAVLPVRWSRFGGGQPLSPFFARFVSSTEERASAPKPSAADATVLKAELEDAPPARRLELLLDRIGDETVHVLGLSELEPKQRLFEVGMDSLMAVDLKNRLATLFGASLPATLIFDHPSVEALARYVASEVLQLSIETKKVDEAAPAAEPDLTDLESLSEEEIQKLFAEKMR